MLFRFVSVSAVQKDGTTTPSEASRIDGTKVTGRARADYVADASLRCRFVLLVSQDWKRFVEEIQRGPFNRHAIVGGGSGVRLLHLSHPDELLPRLALVSGVEEDARPERVDLGRKEGVTACHGGLWQERPCPFGVASHLYPGCAVRVDHVAGVGRSFPRQRVERLEVATHQMDACDKGSAALLIPTDVVLARIGKRFLKCLQRLVEAATDENIDVSVHSSIGGLACESQIGKLLVRLSVEPGCLLPP